MEKIRYIYVDDDLAEAKGTAYGFESEPLGLSVDVFPPTTNGTDILQVIKKYDGVILDLRLDLAPEFQANTRGTSLAQQIRTQATENSIKDLPIILLSADSKLKESFYKDSTSHDLFDFKLTKQSIGDEHSSFEDIQKKLIAYAKAYQILNKSPLKTALEVFNLKDTDNCYSRFVYYLEQYSSHTPAHEWIRMIQEEVLAPGVLIDETWLATRLGVDLNSLDWELIKNQFKNAQYSGILSDYYSRWWMHLIENWWETTFPIGVRLENLTAQERVNELKRTLKLEHLQPLQKLPESKDTHFWFVCKVTQKPLTAADGLLLMENTKKEWHEPNYISIGAYIKEQGKGKIWKAIDVTEKTRAEKLKKQFARERRKK